MELSPKQQSVELIKNSKRILIISHKNPDGDSLGSALALTKSLLDLDKSTDLVISDEIPGTFQYLPLKEKIKSTYNLAQGKVLRIDTTKIPVSGMKYQKTDNSLDIILDADKNLKFEFIEIVNGTPKPDAIIVLDTPAVEKIDAVYGKNTELFFEAPIINIDHHPGNEYFGTVNLVDLTASSTAEILVSLFEALGVKISDADTATCLLTGIISDTQSFRSQTTTPKSLTVAAQLLAAGGRQQEIISNLYKKRPIALMKLWEEMLNGISKDQKHSFAWVKFSHKDLSRLGVSSEDVLEAADELLAKIPETKTILIICETTAGKATAKIKTKGQEDEPELNQLFGGRIGLEEAVFDMAGVNLEEIELKILNKLHGFWMGKAQNAGETTGSDLWSVVAEDGNLSVPVTDFEKQSTATGEQLSHPETEAEIEATTAPKDVIDSALKSIAEEQLNKENTLTPLSGIIEQKKREFLKEEEIDVFDETE